MPRDPLHDQQPHTPTTIPDSRPTCSAPGGANKGCDQFARCKFVQEKNASKGPFQVVVEDHRDCKQGEGRRVLVWCFNFMRQFYNWRKDDQGNPSEGYGGMKQGYSLCDDRAYAELETKTVAEAEHGPDGKLVKPAQFKNVYKPAKLKPYAEQGPYPWAGESAAPDGALEAIREAQRKGQREAVEAAKS